MLNRIALNTGGVDLVDVGDQSFIPTGVYTDNTFTEMKTVFDGIDTDIPNKTGVDVSEMQGAIDWNKVKECGINFAIIRVGYRGMTEGDLFEDERFKENLRNAKDAGLECGVYFFSQAITVEEAKEEAEYVLKLLGGTSLAYPIAFDYEVIASGMDTRVINVSPEDATQIAEAFCTTIEKADYDVMIYGNQYDLNHFSAHELSDRPIWLANYSETPAYTGEYRLWQYTSTGQVAGIETVVDLNLDMATVQKK